MRDQRHADDEGDRADPKPRRRRLRAALRWLPDAVVVLLVVAAGANLQFDLGERWFGATPAHEPAKVLPPAGLHLAASAVAPPVATSSAGAPIDPAAVRAAIAPYVGAGDLGRHVDVAVSDLASGSVVYRSGAGPVTPASTTKLLTTTAALEALGPTTRFRTTVRRSGDRIVLVGGGDPFLATDRSTAKGLYPARATLDDLATRTATALSGQGMTTVHLSYDASLFTGPPVSPDWPATYLPDNVVPPISALWTDEGQDAHGRYVADPPQAAATAFAAALARHGVTVRGPVAAAVSAPTDTEIAAVESAPLGEIVERTLAVSDNNAAEVIGHQVGLAVRHDGSFAGGTAAVMEVLQKLGVDTTGSTVYDGSGLSRRDRLTPQTLLDVLRVAAAADHPGLRSVITGLPVAGFVGSLQERFDDAPAAARGRVRAKTGTLTGVSGLAGIATDLDGNRMAFVVIADRIAVPKTLAARHALDLIAGALGACRCGSTS
ncbi:D-alanyl-D-alanine carboxypeptidase/D-alanyl-D-alanine endopeptidase [Nocardioides pocheonensis]|uniref:D-alanyl-D-alanine carboxypeptidase/D-alanyl-D-alanine-endopeptidase n=1 Tax=Nocardioides pocheonensis TaxID=661485 RepID=A0A3N0GWB3_9ACTN|nr:D-alanyl-D-alanine carboxypeptidase/D-alanyl-D-alanine-endopeptidase [Nocardioides pocheonensis]RNM16753.1 D-alanyl-D-alanine carboxypeptidase/D-alanyl-D-alanine-endopeptidase [Nocardioides pocheonensis]